MLKSSVFLLTYCLGTFALLQAATIPSECDLKCLTTKIQEIKGMPNDVEKVKEVQKYGVETAKYLLKYTNKTMFELEAKVNEAGIAMRNMKAETDSLDFAIFESTKAFVKEFIEAKNFLLAAKRDLVSLSTKLILLSKNIETNIDNWQEEYADLLLKYQFTELNRIIEETKTKLVSAEKNIKEIYLIYDGSRTEEELESFRKQLWKGTNTNKKEYKAWTKIIKESYNDGNNSTVTIGEVIAAITKCSDPCIGVSKITAWINTALTSDDAIPKYTNQLKLIIKKIQTAQADTNALSNNAGNTVILMQKANILIKDLEKVSKTITLDNFSEEEMELLSANKEDLKQSVVNLKVDAETFYAVSNPKQN